MADRHVLGLSALYHDSAAVLLRNGRVVAAASEERFSRIKHDPALPLRASRWCMDHAGIGPGDLERVVYYEKPLRKFERILVTQVLGFPHSFNAFRRGTQAWLAEKLWVGNSIASGLGIRPDRLLFSDHHQSHAASSFYCSPFEEAAVLTADGVGEWASTTLWRAGPGGLEPLGEILFPHSIGLVYSAFTAYLGFRVNNGEYKVMGMAAYGEPRFVEQVRQVIDRVPEGGFAVDTSMVSYHRSATDAYGAAFEALFGPARFPGSEFDPSDAEGRRYADIAASIQAVTEDLLVDLAGTLHEKTGCANLCMAGGVALNSVANHAVLTRSPFESLFINPAAGDAGGAMGAALWAWCEVLEQPRPPPLERADLGQSWDDAAIEAVLTDLRYPFERLDEAALVARAADDVAAGSVIGWFQGGFEWGPRALGHRSILADPSRADMKDRINGKIKFREMFRPFAPAVTAAAADEYFQIPPGAEHVLQWMLMVCPVRPAGRDALPATTHADGTARVQVVHPERSPRYHALLEAVGERTGHPCVLNTSFNLKGEPIVASPMQALATLERCGIDALYLGSYRVVHAADE